MVILNTSDFSSPINKHHKTTNLMKFSILFVRLIQQENIVWHQKMLSHGTHNYFENDNEGNFHI